MLFVVLAFVLHQYNDNNRTTKQRDNDERETSPPIGKNWYIENILQKNKTHGQKAPNESKRITMKKNSEKITQKMNAIIYHMDID